MTEPVILQLTSPAEGIPDWADEVAVDPNGDIWCYGHGCEWDADIWVQPHEENLLRIGSMFPVQPEAAKRLRFRLVRSN